MIMCLIFHCLISCTRIPYELYCTVLCQWFLYKCDIKWTVLLIFITLFYLIHEILWNIFTYWNIIYIMSCANYFLPIHQENITPNTTHATHTQPPITRPPNAHVRTLCAPVWTCMSIVVRMYVSLLVDILFLIV